MGRTRQGIRFRLVEYKQVPGSFRMNLPETAMMLGCQVSSLYKYLNENSDVFRPRLAELFYGGVKRGRQLTVCKCLFDRYYKKYQGQIV